MTVRTGHGAALWLSHQGMGISSLRRRLFLLVSLLMLAGCSGIPGSGPVHDVSKVANAVGLEAPPTPIAGQSQVPIVRAFIEAASRVSLAGATGSTYAVPKQYLTTPAQTSWQAASSKPAVVQILSNDTRVEATGTDPSVVTITGTSEGTLDADKTYHTGNGASYKVTVHLQQEKGQWRISDPPEELLIRLAAFSSVFSARTLYFLDASHTVVVPDRRYLINGGTAKNRVSTLVNLLLAGPAGVLQGAAQSELAGGTLRSNVTTDPTGLITSIDLLGVDLLTAADRTALAAQLVWSLYPDAVKVAIFVNGAPLDSVQPDYSISTFESFSPDRVPGTGSVASDPYFIDGQGAVVDLLTKAPSWGFGTGSAHIVSAGMSAATGTLAAVSTIADGQALLIGRPTRYDVPRSALKATTLTPPSFTRSGDEVWVVQNGGSNPEIYQISASAAATASGIASRAKVAAVGLAGKGAVTGLTLSPDGVRLALVAGGHLYIGAIAAQVVAPKPGSVSTSGAETPNSLTVINLEQVRGELNDVGPVAFRKANQLLVVAKSSSGSYAPYRSITEMNVDGYEPATTTTTQLPGDIQAMAVSTVDSAPVSAADNSQVAAAVYIIWGAPGQTGEIWRLKGSLADGLWETASASSPLVGTNLFFPN